MPRDLAASSRSRRSTVGKRRADASAVPPVSTCREDVPPAVVHERALGEIRHELGNFFHKLYYWIDALHEPRGGAGAEPTAGRMLEQTVRNLEDFLGTALDYFRPVALTPVLMAAGEVVAGVRARVEGVCEPAGFALETPVGWDARPLLVDPGQLPGVLDVALRRLVAQAPAATPIQVAVRGARHEGRDGLAIAMALGGAAARIPAFHSAAANLAWAVAQRVAALHGGELSEPPSTDGERAVALFLPYHV